MKLLTDKKYYFQVLVLFLIIIFSFFIGKKEGETRQKKISDFKYKQLSGVCKEEYSYISTDLAACIENRGRITSSNIESYNFESFGIHSPLFEGKDVAVTRYRYLGADIVHKTLDIDSTRIVVHYVETPEKYLKKYYFDEKMFSKSSGIVDIPTFGGYENYALNPTLISDFAKIWSDDSYTNAKGIKVYFIDNYTPREIGSVSAQFFSTYSPLGYSIFVDVMQDVEDPFSDKSDLSIMKSKEDLIKIRATAFSK